MSIRCSKCGYDKNPDHAKKCDRCKSFLSAAAGEPVRSARGNDTQVVENVNRPEWGAEFRAHTVEIPVKRPPEPENDGQKTILRPLGARPKSCSLVALSVDGQQELKAIPVAGENLTLNRALLEADNTSLSREGQASLVQKNGEWWLENLSKMKTTFVQVNRPVKLADGDIILMGDTLYRFKENG